MQTKATRLYPFVPSGGDFKLALQFFNEIGFLTTWQDGGLAGMRFGAAYFLLQNIDIPKWQENQMHTFDVDDLELYSRELQALDLPTRYPGVQIRPPTNYDWGREIHLRDPAGVCWHVRQSMT